MDAAFGPDGHRGQAGDGDAVGAPGGVVTPGVLGETAYGLNLPPLLQGVAGPTQPGGFTAPNTSTPAYGYGLAFGRSVWLGLQGPGMSPLLTANTGQHPWSWLSQFQPALWSKVNRAFTDALARARAGGSPSALCSQLAFQAGAGASGATVTGDGWAQLGEAIDETFGFLDGLTGGQFSRALGTMGWLTGINLNNLADTSSSAYTGSYTLGVEARAAAGVALMVLSVLAPELAPLIMAAQALSFGWSAAVAFQKGDWKTGVFDVGMGLLSLTGAGEALEGAEVAGLAAGEAEAPAAAETAAEAIPAGVEEAPAAELGAAEGEAGTALNPEQAAPTPAEPPAEGENLYKSDESIKTDPGNCFPAGTLVGTLCGLRVIETIQADERVWAYDLITGQWRPCRVIQTFRRHYDGQSVFVTAEGDTIESTLLHPWWVVRGEGLAERPVRSHLREAPAGAAVPGRWVDAADLRVGDELLLREGRTAVVEAVRTGPFHDLVYNFQVAELECYSVGSIGALVHNENGNAGNQAASAKALGEARNVAEPPALTEGQQAIRDSLLEEHPNLNPDVAAEAARNGIFSPGAGGEGADVELANGGGREVSVHTGNLDNLGGHILDEAEQRDVTEIFMQVNTEGVTQEDVLAMVQGPDGLRANLGDAASGKLVRIFGPDGQSWWSGIFR